MNSTNFGIERSAWLADNWVMSCARQKIIPPKTKHNKKNAIYPHPNQSGSFRVDENSNNSVSRDLNSAFTVTYFAMVALACLFFPRLFSIIMKKKWL